MYSNNSSSSFENDSSYKSESEEENFKAQLEKIYNFCSNCFRIDIDNPNSLIEIISLLIKDAKSLKKENKMLKSNSKLPMKDESFSEKSEKSEKIQNNRYKKKNDQLQQQIVEMQTIINDNSAKIQELTLTNINLTTQNKKLQDDIANMKKETQQDDITERESVVNAIESTLSTFENVIKMQSDEIAALIEQREQLTIQVEAFDKIYYKIETEIQTLEENKNATLASFNALQSTISEYESLFPSIVEEIHEFDIPYNLISKSESIHDFIIETISNIMNRNNILLEKKGEQPADTVSKEEYDLILRQLEGSIKFIQNIANTEQPNEDKGNMQPLFNNSIARSLLLTQCARIGHFINNTNFIVNTSDPTIFDPKILSSPVTILQPLLEKTPPEVMAQSPTRELFAFFVGVCEVNKLLMNYLENSEKGNKEVTQAQLNRLEELELWKNDQENKIQRIANEIGMPNFSHDTFLDHFLNAYLEIIDENKELQQQFQKSPQESPLKEIEKNQTINPNDFQEQIDQLEDLLNKQNQKYQSECLALKNELQKYKEENEQLSQTIQTFSEVIQKKDKKYKKARLAQDDLQGLIETVENKVKLVSDDNERLNRNINEMGEVLKKQNIDLEKAGKKIQKLHEQKTFLKEKLHESEENNTKTLTENSKRTEQLNDKYSEIIQNLENDLKEAKEKLKQIDLEKEDLIKQKNDISSQLIKSRVNERALNIKIEALESRSLLNKKESESAKSALIQSIRAEANIKIENTKADLDKLIIGLIRIMSDRFRIIFAENPTTDEVLARAEMCLKSSYDTQMKIEDANQARLILQIPDSQTLTKGSKAIIDRDKKLVKQNSELKAQSELVRKKSAEVDLRRSEQERAIRIAADWENWSKSIFYQITDGTAVVQSSKDIRFLLEEALLSTIGHHGLLTKLEILKAEKKLFSIHCNLKNLGKANYRKTNSDNKDPSNEPEINLPPKIVSIRPVMVAVMSTRRLQVISHRLPIKFSTRQKKDQNEQPRSFGFSLS